MYGLENQHAESNLIDARCVLICSFAVCVMKSHDLKKKADRQTDQLSRLKSCMHATRKDGREEDRKVRSMFVSSCVAEHATVALWNNTLFRDKFYC